MLCAELRAELRAELHPKLRATLPALPLVALLVEPDTVDAMDLVRGFARTLDTITDVGGDSTPSLRGVAARSESFLRTSRPFSSNLSR
jgi:hypothetical protein